MQTFTAFEGQRRLITGALADVALAVKRAGATPSPIAIFDDHTGRTIDLDLRGSDAEILARLPQGASNDVPVAAPASAPRGRGRTKLGVDEREETLLPRQ